MRTSPAPRRGSAASGSTWPRAGTSIDTRGTLDRHARAYPHAHEDLLPVGGIYAWRREGEHHMWNPESIALLQHAVRHGGAETFEEYSKLMDGDGARRGDL